MDNVIDFTQARRERISRRLVKALLAQREDFRAVMLRGIREHLTESDYQRLCDSISIQFLQEITE